MHIFIKIPAKNCLIPERAVSVLPQRIDLLLVHARLFLSFSAPDPLLVRLCGDRPLESCRSPPSSCSMNDRFQYPSASMNDRFQYPHTRRLYEERDKEGEEGDYDGVDSIYSTHFIHRVGCMPLPP